jgi:single-strand DNA-binding protein
MAGDLNVVAMVGRLTRDSELRMTQSGNGILRFSIAVNRRKRTADGNWEDEANFFDCSLFGKSAQTMANYLKKGRQVAIQGELRQDRWNGQDGQTRNRVEIAVNSLQLVGSGRQDGGAPAQGDSGAQDYPQRPYTMQQPGAPVAPAQPQPQMAPGVEQFDDDDIPF